MMECSWRENEELYRSAVASLRWQPLLFFLRLNYTVSGWKRRREERIRNIVWFVSFWLPTSCSSLECLVQYEGVPLEPVAATAASAFLQQNECLLRGQDNALHNAIVASAVRPLRRYLCALFSPVTSLLLKHLLLRTAHNVELKRGRICRHHYGDYCICYCNAMTSYWSEVWPYWRLRWRFHLNYSWTWWRF